MSNPETGDILIWFDPQSNDTLSLLIKDQFSAVEAALDNLSLILECAIFDCTPIILIHPPSRRAERKTSLEAMRSSFGAYQERMDGIERRMMVLKGGLMRQRSMCVSTLAPVSAMPPELLRSVFAFVSCQNMYTSPHDYPHAGSRLAQVCSEWRDVALQQYDLWSSFDRSNPWSGKAIDMFLSRSGSLPFHLRVEEDRLPRFDLSGSDRYSRNLRNRLTHLEWETSTIFTRFLTRFDRDAEFPLLETLFIIGGEHCYTCDCPNDYDRLMEYPEHQSILPDVFPVLATLHLERVHYLPPSSLLRRLKELRIVACPVTHQICRQIFEDAVVLESLEISSLTVMQEFMEDDYEERVFQIPSLQRLALADVPIDVAMCVLNSCACPTLDSLLVRNIEGGSNITNGAEHLFLEAFNRFVRHLGLSPFISYADGNVFFPNS